MAVALPLEFEATAEVLDKARRSAQDSVPQKNKSNMRGRTQ
jgi:hypothetical protein